MTQSDPQTSSNNPQDAQPEAPQAVSSQPQADASATTPQTIPTPPAESPPETAPTEPKEIRILRNLHEGFKAALKLFDDAPQQKLYVVIQEDEGLRPEIHEVADIPELVRLLLPYRGSTACVYVFKGQRWLLKPGHVWQIYDGETFIPLTLEDTPEDLGLRTDGSMFLPPSIDELARQEPEEPAEEVVEHQPAPQLAEPVVDPVMATSPLSFSNPDDDEHDPELVAE